MRRFLPHVRTLSALAFGLPIAFTSSMLAGCDISGSGSPAIHPNLTDLRSEWVVTPDEAYRWASLKRQSAHADGQSGMAELHALSRRAAC